MSLPKRILLVEDDRVLRRACEVGLRKRGFEVVTAEDGVEGLRLALERSFDLVLLDMLMPKMSGMDMLRQLRRERPDQAVKVLILSNSSKADARQDAETLGVAGYMVKADLTLEGLGMVVADLTRDEAA